VKVPAAQSNSILARLAAELAIATLFFAMPAAVGQQHPSQQSNALAQAQSAASQGNVEAAIKILSDHLQSHPNDAAALVALGGLYDSAGHPDKAEPLLAGAAKLSPTPQVRAEWATVLARLHRYREARNAIAGVQSPTDRYQRIAFYRLQASIASGLGDSASAASKMEEALALNADDPRLAMAAAAAQVQAGKWQRAATLAGPVFSRTHDPGAGLVLLQARLELHENVKQMLESLRAINMPPQREAAFRQRIGELLISHDQAAEAVEDFQRVAALEPGRADVLFNAALAEFRAGNLKDALESAEKCKAMADSAEVEDLLGDVQEAQGDNLAAVKSYQAAVALAPDKEKYRLSLALELIRHNSFEPAKVVLKQAEELFPNSWRIQLAEGMVEYFAGTEQDADRKLLRAADLSPEPEAALQYLGDVQLDQSSPPDPAAVAHICQYADRHPHSAKMEFYCGAILLRRDYGSRDKSHVAEILRRLQAAARALPDDASPHCQLGRAYRWTEQWHDALRESETCVRMNPDSADAHYRLAQIYRHMGDAERSEQQMRLYRGASQRLADENARREQTMKGFVYLIQKDAATQKELRRRP
jgi:tetratricopeptide (TPR) repeat protein